VPSLNLTGHNFRKVPQKAINNVRVMLKKWSNHIANICMDSIERVVRACFKSDQDSLDACACKHIIPHCAAPSTHTVINLQFVSAMTVPVNPVCSSICESSNIIFLSADQKQHSVSFKYQLKIVIVMLFSDLVCPSKSDFGNSYFKKYLFLILNFSYELF